MQDGGDGRSAASSFRSLVGCGFTGQLENLGVKGLP